MYFERDELIIKWTFNVLNRDECAFFSFSGMQALFLVLSGWMKCKDKLIF